MLNGGFLLQFIRQAVRPEIHHTRRHQLDTMGLVPLFNATLDTIKGTRHNDTYHRM